MRKGQSCSPETRAKISAAKTGVPLTAETRAKIGAAQKGVPKSPELRAKIAAASRRPEVRAKKSAAMKGRKAGTTRVVTAESRARLRAALIAYCQRDRV